MHWCYCWGGFMICCVPTLLQLLIAIGIFTRTWSMMFIHVYYVYKNVPRWLFRNYRIQAQTISKYEHCVRPRSKFCLQGRSQSAAPQTKWELNWGLAVHIGCAWGIRGRCMYKMDRGCVRQLHWLCMRKKRKLHVQNGSWMCTFPWTKNWIDSVDHTEGGMRICGGINIWRSEMKHKKNKMVTSTKLLFSGS